MNAAIEVDDRTDFENEIDNYYMETTREQKLEAALLQMLGTFDNPIVRMYLKAPCYREAIEFARYLSKL